MKAGSAAERVIRACAWLVPAGRRADWRRQWNADLACQHAYLIDSGHSERAAARDLFRRSTGALPHALWLRAHQWRTLMILQDLKFAARSLRQRPVFTAAIVLTLGLGIGANATIFSWLDALVLNPLPGVPRASELAMVRFATPTRPNLSFSYPNYIDVRDSRPHGIKAMAVHELLPVSMRVDANAMPERAWAQLGSGNLFEVLEIGAAIGRTLQVSDETARAHVAVISHDLWRSRFNADPGIVGRSIALNTHSFSIVGVAPAGFRGSMNGLAVDLWVPVTTHRALSGRNVIDERGSGWLTTVARVEPGVSTEQVQASLTAVAAELARRYPSNTGRTLRLAPLREDGAAQVLLPIVSIVFVVVAIVLLIACANVSGLLVARAVGRRHEVTIRAALGASRMQLVRQLFVESLLLASLGGAAGIAMTVWTSRGLDRLLPPLPYPVMVGAGVNVRVLAFSAAVILLSTVVFGLAPALQGSRSQLQSTLGSRRAAATPGRARLRRVLVGAQIALATVLLVSAGLFGRTLANAYDVDPGFSRRDAVLAAFDLTSVGYDATRGRAFYDQLLSHVSALPGVEAASLSTMVPLNIGGGADTSPEIKGYTPMKGEEVTVYYAMVAPDYFRTMGIPIVDGRPIDARDRREALFSVVINETMARRYWNGRNPIGGQLRIGDRWATVIGVARDGKYGTLSEAPLSLMYFPLEQAYRADPVLHVATNGPAEASIAAVRKAVSEIAPDLALFEVRTLREHLQTSVVIPRIGATLLAIFGGLALTLAAIGLYGVIAFAASQRTQEIGVRMALGADRTGILRQILGEGAKVAVTGVIAGLGAAALATPLIGSVLVNVSPTDLLTFTATAGVLLVVSLAASFIPALRASRLDPVEALRAD